jgi:hypothetical protein
MPKRGHVKTTYHLRKVEEMKWVRELGVNKIIHKTNRILRRWGVNCLTTITTLSYPKADFILEETYLYAIGIERTDKYLAYISLRYQTVVCPLGSFVYAFSLPSKSWLAGYSKVGTSLVQHPPLNLSLPIVLAARALAAKVTDLYRGWVGLCGCWRHDPLNYIAVVIARGYAPDQAPSLTILFGRRNAVCMIANGGDLSQFVGGHTQAVAKALKVIALLSL